MEYTVIKVDKHKDGSIYVITFNRPEKMNCISPETAVELCHIFDAFREDLKAKVAILTGAGDQAFSAGGDLTRHEDTVPFTEADKARHTRGEVCGLLGPSRWTDLYKPVICCINGVAYAGGLEWACWRDIRVVEEHASFGVTCRRWNAGLGDGGTQRLPRIVGMGRAMELIITGRVIGAEEALRIGLANEVVPKGKGLTRSLELASLIADLPLPAIMTDKEAAVRGFGQDLRTGLLIEAECFNRLTMTEEMKTGVDQFRNRDHPDRRKDSGKALTPGLVRPNSKL